MNTILFFDWGMRLKEKRLSYKDILNSAYTNGFEHKEYVSFQGVAFSVSLGIIYKENEIIFRYKEPPAQENAINKLIKYTPNKLIVLFGGIDETNQKRYVQNFLKQDFDIYVNDALCNITNKNFSNGNSVIINFSGSKTINIDEILEVKIQFK
nr:hypothetical protein [uncultured Capnocytophaga sp.]